MLLIANLEIKMDNQKLMIKSQIDEVKLKLRERGASDKELAMLDKAFDLAYEAHKGMFRKSGEIYFTHPLEVMKILSDLPVDIETLVSSLLHDSVEDAGLTLDIIEKEFGKHVSEIVNGVTKLKKTNFHDEEADNYENLRKIFVAMAKDIRVILVKLADRLHNLRTIKYLPKERQIRMAKESMEIYAPIADRLGIWKMKSEIEDKSFEVLMPDEYNWIKFSLEDQLKYYEKNLEKAKEIILSELEKDGIKCININFRVKHIYSIYKKAISKYGRDLSLVYDLGALRVICENVSDCYATLGIVHKVWTPLQYRFKDFIAVPKPNGYRSLHTTVFGPEGKLIEIQIRTEEMHEEAELGIAARSVYNSLKGTKSYTKRKLTKKDFVYEDWIKRLANWDKEIEEKSSYSESLREDIFGDTIFVFTPKGKALDLPVNSTPVDAAYKIHSELGDKMVGAKINNKIVELDYKLKDGDIIEVLTSESRKGPSRDWLNFVVTSKAKSKIRSWIREQNKGKSLEKGIEILETTIKNHFGKDVLERVNKYLDENRILGFKTKEDLLSALGDGFITINKVIKNIPIAELSPEITTFKTVIKSFAQPKYQSFQGDKTKEEVPKKVSVAGENFLDVYFAKCCDPKPPDLIVGFLSREKGVVVHRATCKNLLSKDIERIIEVFWSDLEKKNTFVTLKVKIEANDRPDLMLDILQEMKGNDINVTSIEGNVFEGKFVVVMEIQFSEPVLIPNVFNKIKNIKDVIYIKRIE